MSKQPSSAMSAALSATTFDVENPPVEPGDETEDVGDEAGEAEEDLEEERQPMYIQKVGVNEPCPCGSGRKYKKCCIGEQQIIGKNGSVIIIGNSKKESKFSTGQATSSDKVLDIMEKLQKKYPNHRIIDITDDLNVGNYKQYQIKNYSSNIIMVAEKIPSNLGVFAERINMDESDILVMYHGSFRSFPAQYYENVASQLLSMIPVHL